MSYSQTEFEEIQKDTTTYKHDSTKNGTNPRITDQSKTKQIKTTNAKEVIITASSILSSKVSRATPTAILTRNEILSMNASSSADALKGVPGVIVREYGGIGSLQTVSIRGTSSQQNIVLIDGVRYSGSSADAFDFSLIPAYSLHKIEVMRGGASAMYGANALGGAINLVTEPRFDDGFGINVGFEVGSFGEKNIFTSTKIKCDSSSYINADAVFRKTNGDFPFSFNEFGATNILYRQNSQAEQFFGKIIWNKSFGQWNVKSSFYSTASNKGVPGAVVQGNREMLKANLKELDLFAAFQFGNINLLQTNTNIFITGKQNRMLYSDPDSKILNSKENKFLRTEISCGLQSLYCLDDSKTFHANSEYNYAKIDGSFFESDSVATSRNNFGLSIRYEQEIPVIKSIIDVGLRGDFFDAPNEIEQQKKYSLNPSIGIVFAPLNNTKIRTKFATSFRLPSFTELYYLNYGNKNLKPEESVSLDVGLALAENIFFSEINLFYISTTDQIVSVPKSAAMWSAMNITRTMSRGVELSVQIANYKLFSTEINANLNYTLLETLDKTLLSRSYNNQLPYTPNEIISFNSTIKYKNFHLSFFSNYQSHRYFLPINLPEYSLGRYMILNSTALQTFSIYGLQGNIKLECLNLLNTEYVLVKNYPMPKRSLKLGIEFCYD